MRSAAGHQLDPVRLEARTEEIGRTLFAAATREHAHLSVLNRWTAQVLAWCLGDPAVKSATLRFIDVLPSLQAPREIARHLREYFPSGFRLPAALRVGAALAGSGLLTQRALAAVIRQGVERVAQQFIARHQPDEAASVLRALAARGAACSLDLLGEQVVSRDEADRYAARCQSLVELCARAYAALPGVPPVVCGPRANLSVKPSALSPRFDPISPEASVQDAAGRLAPILEAAARAGASVTLDMEHYELRDLTLALARHLLDHAAAARGRLGIVLQAYLTDTDGVADAWLAWLESCDQPLTIRLVKGAYWDTEVASAVAAHWPVPVYEDKGATDAAFERLTRRLLAAAPRVTTAIASHNVRSIAHAIAVAEALGLRRDQLEFQLLYGMGEALQAAITGLGYPVRVYTPIGELIPGMAYLVRRILENTANESFLRQDFFQQRGADELLRPPQLSPTQPPRPASSGWTPEPPADFSRADARARMSAALAAVRQEGGARYPLWLAGARVDREPAASRNPAFPGQVVGWVSWAKAADVDAAVDAAGRAQRRWAQTSIPERAACLRRTASLVRAHRFTLAAHEVLEVGKGWREADADVVETIEYLEYYSAQMLRLAGGAALDQAPGERNLYRYEPRGVAVVIAPWNFPSAILAGMTSAALVTGNPVIVKPAEQSSVAASRLIALFQEAGLPSGVLQCLPGSGEEIGAALVRHPGVHTVLFTGSKAVGLSIVQACSAVAPGQRHVKHIIAEMGGKNAIIVDADADLDAAVQGILRSAFGYGGQKCSAASRLIVLDAVYDRLLPRLLAAADRLIVGDPAHPATDVGPLIEASAQARLQDAVARAGRVAYRYPADRLPAEGYFVGPAIVTDLSPHDPLAQQELFGPLLAVFRVPSFSEALALANDTDYALTGGVYSRTPSHLEEAIQAFDVGTLYINRPITGAAVGRQPFGGRRLSGLGTKAGGPDYLLSLLLPKTICINTARHGIPLE